MYIQVRSEETRTLHRTRLSLLRKKKSQNYNNNNVNILSHAMLLLLNVLRKTGTTVAIALFDSNRLRKNGGSWAAAAYLGGKVKGFGIVEDI